MRTAEEIAKKLVGPGLLDSSLFIDAVKAIQTAQLEAKAEGYCEGIEAIELIQFVGYPAITMPVQQWSADRGEHIKAIRALLKTLEAGE